jgi:hypothetical protein
LEQGAGCPKGRGIAADIAESADLASVAVDTEVAAATPEAAKTEGAIPDAVRSFSVRVRAGGDFDSG